MKYLRNEDVLVRRHEAELALIFDDSIFKINEVGESIWRLLIEEKDFEEIIDGLQAEYDVDRSVLGKDVRSFLEKMVTEELVTTKEL